MTDKEMRMYGYIVETGVATAEEINLVFNISGQGWTNAINAIVFARTGYRTYDQMIESEEEE